MDDLYSLTVIQLKERLKEKGLPVSGKKADLIARLKEDSGISFVLGEKYEIECSACPTILRVPCDYSGNITCPQCDAKSVISAEEEESESHFSGLIAEVPMESTSHSLTTNAYEFVTGPDGQTYAVKKSDFSWADWSIGFFGTVGYFVLSFVFFIDVADEMCCLLLVFGGPAAIGGGGFAASKPGIGVGALTALVALPLLFFVGCFFLIATY